MDIIIYTSDIDAVRADDIRTLLENGGYYVGDVIVRERL